MVHAGTIFGSDSICNIAIHIHDFQIDFGLRILYLYIFHCISNEFLTRFVHYLAMVTNLQIQGCLGHIGLHGFYPYKALSALGMLRSLHSIEAVDDIHAHQRRVNQGILSRHGMRSYALHLNGSAASVKGLVNHLAQLTAVDGIGKINGEFAEIQLLRAAQAHFLIGHEANINITM